jgi:phenylacetic acid degradation operon negative regulatory protein
LFYVNWCNIGCFAKILIHPANKNTDMETVQPIAKDFLLKLLGVVNNDVLDITAAIQAGAVFDLSPNNIRVAINRLQSSGLIEPMTRGAYQLSIKGRVLRDEISLWRSAESLIQPWDGSWIAALTTVNKSNRSILRNTNRAFALVGMQELHSGLYIRPNNIQQGTTTIKKKLLSLECDPNIILFNAENFDPPHAKNASQLWDTVQMEKSYLEQTQILNESMLNIKSMQLKDAARESYLLGDHAIKKIIFDPLLPSPLINIESRLQFRQTLIEYDKIGHQIWSTLLQSEFF